MLAGVPADLRITGNLDVEQETPRLKIEITADRDRATEKTDSGTSGRMQLVSFAAQIAAPVGHCVVLGVAPSREQTLAFAVQVRPGD
jgi:hypothetical protein